MFKVCNFCISQDWIQTLCIRIMSQVFGHCWPSHNKYYSVCETKHSFTIKIWDFFLRFLSSTASGRI
jgi:hypothetical protein